MYQAGMTQLLNLILLTRDLSRLLIAYYRLNLALISSRPIFLSFILVFTISFALVIHFATQLDFSFCPYTPRENLIAAAPPFTSLHYQATKKWSSTYGEFEYK